MIWNGENGCEVKKGRKYYIVNVEDRICSCRSWYYHNETYLKAYAHALQPINGLHEWRKSGIKLVLPPVEKTMPGRKKKHRGKAKNEPKKVWSGQLSRASLIMRCRKCGGESHNRRSCNQPNTTRPQFGTSTRTRSQKRMTYQDPINTQESTATKKMKK
ncbi:hypothetical protein Gohar_024340 [Gossypium harknessii]|uniref:CCHC-type domain-containing protein n=1 Tax=Gossypium harknessii TaxID=34285 RepID=A0A7J9HFL4_9ROSI|nr:hypothetical protein [Gossypium harknessii]